ncbi:transposase [Candidatus Uhrbacteria bacterium]|nr:transposase [Candidatus Uhrbacteria bacterium]
MPRTIRSDIADMSYHVINRANARVQIFSTQQEFRQFEDALSEAREKTGMRIYAYVIMPNHWHLVVSPCADGDLKRFMACLTMTHTQRWHRDHNSVGTGHLYQGRYKAFIVGTDDYFITVCRYVEQNPLRANLTPRADEWRWGSLWRRQFGSREEKAMLSSWITEAPRSYLQWVNERDEDDRLERIRTCVNRGRPFGSPTWTEEIVKRFKLESTLRSVGRPWDKNNGS